MTVELLEPKLIKSPNVGFGNHGSYTLESPFNFEICRERFAAVFKFDTECFYFKHPRNRGLHVAEFIHKIENLLKVEYLSNFALTNRPTILWVQPSLFWRECPMKRSLLTSLLRSGITYDFNEDNFELALLSNAMPSPHLSNTRNALLRFLCGYTEYHGPKLMGSDTLITQGWQYVFEGKDAKTIRAYLKHPNGKRPRINPAKLDLSDVMWT